MKEQKKKKWNDENGNNETRFNNQYVWAYDNR